MIKLLKTKVVRIASVVKEYFPDNVVIPLVILIALYFGLVERN
jgi:hypothetical protein